MKRLNYIAALLIGTLVVSCDSSYLEPAPTAGITSGNFYKNAAEVEAAIINMYDGIQGTNSTSSNVNHGVMYEFYLTEIRSDNTKTKSFEGEQAEFEEYTITPNNGIITDYYASFYNVIARANVVLENLESVENTTTRAAFEAEAKFVRAYAYFNLVRLYGDIPLIDKTISPLDKDVQFTRVPAANVYSLIVSDLTTAVSGLSNSYRTRASKAAAQALLAKVYLTQGSNYSEARTLLESVMSSGFSLESNFKDIFYKEDNSEVIFGIGYAPDLTSDSQNFSAEWLNAVGRTTGVNYVTDEARAAIDEQGGSRTSYSYRQDALQNQFYQVVKYLPNGDDNLGISATSSDATLAGNDWIVLRYADVLLMHAEAILAGGASTSDANALSSVNMVRARAGLDALTTLSKADLLAERRVELAFENHRFFDLVRFNEAENVLSKYSADNGYSFSTTDLLLPIPQREINLSKGALTQNPGY